MRIERRCIFALASFAYVMFWFVAFFYWFYPYVAASKFVIMPWEMVFAELSQLEIHAILIFLTAGSLTLLICTVYGLVELFTILEPYAYNMGHKIKNRFWKNTHTSR